MNNMTFPRWSGPFVGMIVGVIVGLKGDVDADLPMAARFLGGAVIGGIAGCLIFLIDPKQQEAASDDLLSHFDARVVTRPSGVVGRVLAIAGILLCWTPFLGLVLNLIGLAVNWKSEDWARKVSIAGVVVGGIVAIVMAIALACEG